MLELAHKFKKLKEPDKAQALFVHEAGVEALVQLYSAVAKGDFGSAKFYNCRVEAAVTLLGNFLPINRRGKIVENPSQKDIKLGEDIWRNELDRVTRLREIVDRKEVYPYGEEFSNNPFEEAAEARKMADEAEAYSRVVGMRRQHSLELRTKQD